MLHAAYLGPEMNRKAPESSLMTKELLLFYPSGKDICIKAVWLYWVHFVFRALQWEMASPALLSISSLWYTSVTTTASLEKSKWHFVVEEACLPWKAVSILLSVFSQCCGSCSSESRAGCLLIGRLLFQIRCMTVCECDKRCKALLSGLWTGKVL